jgi:toxin ParE1/3/4
MRLRWNADTLEALELIYAIRARCDPDAARSFVFRVAEVTGRLLTLPTSGQPGKTKGMWLLAVPGTPYVIVYRVEGETVDILSMVYTADREGIWNWGEGVVCDERTWTQTARGRTASRRPARSRSQGPRQSKPRHSDGTADSTQARQRRRRPATSQV